MRRLRSPHLALVLACAACASLASDSSTEHAPERAAPRNVVLMIADGFGPASAALGRAVRGAPLALDGILVGSITTHASDSLVTDSAAAATALASGIKTYNGAVGVDASGAPVTNVLAEAEERGLATGLVVTCRITHATPACFSASVAGRDDEPEIARQQIERGIDLLLGGGRSMYEPVERGGQREDGLDLLERARVLGYSVFEDGSLLGEIDALPALGLFASSHLAYDVDRDPAVEPSLVEMTRAALALLARDEDGFFLMIEGSRIDHAGHANDAAAHAHDVLAFDEAVAAVLDFARARGDTLVISTADHETGGLSLGAEVGGVSYYEWDPARLARASASSEAVWSEIESGADPTSSIRARAPLDDATDEELAPVLATLEVDGGGRARAFQNALSRLVSDKARIGWTTHGHTAVDVGLYAFGPGAERFRGQHDNTDVARLVSEMLGLELDAR
jgi:alkaline phosphatase